MVDIPFLHIGAGLGTRLKEVAVKNLSKFLSLRGADFPRFLQIRLVANQNNRRRFAGRDILDLQIAISI